MKTKTTHFLVSVEVPEGFDDPQKIGKALENSRLDIALHPKDYAAKAIHITAPSTVCIQSDGTVIKINQCDGCCRGLPVDEKNIHRGDNFIDSQVCTRDRYEN